MKGERVEWHEKVDDADAGETRRDLSYFKVLNDSAHGCIHSCLSRPLVMNIAYCL